MNQPADQTAAILAEKHAAAATAAQVHLNGGEITPAEKQAANDFLEWVSGFLVADAPASEQFAYLAESGTTAVRMRRAAAAPIEPA